MALAIPTMTTMTTKGDDDDTDSDKDHEDHNDDKGYNADYGYDDARADDGDDDGGRSSCAAVLLQRWCNAAALVWHAVCACAAIAELVLQPCVRCERRRRRP